LLGERAYIERAYVSGGVAKAFFEEDMADLLSRPIALGDHLIHEFVGVGMEGVTSVYVRQ
jgi:hypothetical protein